MYYWPGEGKKGQFPSGFGKRHEFKGSAANTRQGALKSSPTTNVTSISEENEQIFACMTMGNSEFKYLLSQILMKPANLTTEYSPVLVSLINKTTIQ